MAMLAGLIELGLGSKGSEPIAFLEDLPHDNAIGICVIMLNKSELFEKAQKLKIELVGF